MVAAEMGWHSRKEVQETSLQLAIFLRMENRRGSEIARAIESIRSCVRRAMAFDEKFTTNIGCDLDRLDAEAFYLTNRLCN